MRLGIEPRDTHTVIDWRTLTIEHSLENNGCCAMCDITQNAIVGMFLSPSFTYYPDILGESGYTLANDDDTGIRLCACNPNARDSRAACSRFSTLADTMIQRENFPPSMYVPNTRTFTYEGGKFVRTPSLRYGYRFPLLCRVIQQINKETDLGLKAISFQKTTVRSIVSRKHGFVILGVGNLIAAVDCLNRTAVITKTEGIFDFSTANSDGQAADWLAAHLYDAQVPHMLPGAGPIEGRYPLFSPVQAIYMSKRTEDRNLVPGTTDSWWGAWWGYLAGLGAGVG
jgi:hypothetical protein